MAVEYIDTRDIPLPQLQRFPGNARRGDVNAIRASIRRTGQYRSLVVRDTDTALVILAGNHTHDAIRAEGQPTARCEIIRCTDDEARRINLADNRLAELGDYDTEALAELLSYLDDDYEGTGYTADDIAALTTPPESLPPDLDAADSVPDPPTEAVTQPGDLWILGPHRIICGDCRDHATIARLLDGATVTIAFTSPPYASQRTYDESSEFKPIPPDQYVDWFEDVQDNVRAHLVEDGSWFVNIKEHVQEGQRHLYVKELTIAHVRRWGWRFIDELVWNKPDPFPGRYDGRFKNAWEPIFHFALGKPKHRPENVLTESDTAIVATRARKHPTQFFNEQLDTVSGPGQVWPSNVITLPAGAESNGSHAAAFPAKLPRWLIRAYADPGDTILDPFLGSGTTLIAAEQEGRIAYGTEISPAYCDVICRRFQQHTGILPVLAATGKEHDFTREPANQ